MRATGFAELYSVNLIGCFIDIHVTGEKDIGAGLLRDFLESFCLGAPHLHCFDLIWKIFHPVAIRERRSAPEYSSNVLLVSVLEWGDQHRNCTWSIAGRHIKRDCDIAECQFLTIRDHHVSLR